MRFNVHLALGLCVIGFLPAEALTAPDVSTMQVWPRFANSLKPINLGDLIVQAIPTGDRMEWDSLQIPNVRWVTEGIDYHGNTSSRLGFVRVRAAGARAKMLRQGWEELAWSVELSTDGNPKWGPTTARITPGFDSAELNGEYICFGTGFEGCDFPIAALRDPRLKLTQKCILGNGANRSIVMSALTTDGRRGTVAYMGSGGSGGYSNSVEVSALSPEEYCTANKDRGY